MPSRASWVIGAELLGASVLLLGVSAAPLAGLRPDGAAGGTAEANAWVVGPRRPDGSIESRCTYDLSQGPVRVTVEPWGGPMTVTVRSGDGRVLASEDERSSPQGVDLTLAFKGQAAPRAARLVISPSRRGLVLERRPAATPERFAAADRARRGDACAPAGMDFPAVPRTRR